MVDAGSEYDAGAYRQRIGRALEELPTPALAIDLDVAGRNVRKMAERFRALPAELRPHVKAHKCPELARMQCEAGAIGVACATAWEAVVMADAGIGDVLVANQVVGVEKLGALAAAARASRITVTVDDARGVERLERAAATAEASVEVLVEIDVGMGRCGVRSSDAAVEVAGLVDAAPHLRFRGLQGYEGHCMLEPDPEARARKAQAANATLLDAVSRVDAAGWPSEVVSAGGTGTYEITGANPGVTEIQAGSYALMDAFHETLVPGTFEVAMTVLTEVVSKQGSTIVLDAGLKAIGVDHAAAALAEDPAIKARDVAEEHAMFDLASPPPYAVGDRIQLTAGYGPTTVNLHDAFHVVENGIVTDVWAIAARGPGPPIEALT